MLNTTPTSKPLSLVPKTAGISATSTFVVNKKDKHLCGLRGEDQWVPKLQSWKRFVSRLQDDVQG